MTQNDPNNAEMKFENNEIIFPSSEHCSLMKQIYKKERRLAVHPSEIKE